MFIYLHIDNNLYECIFFYCEHIFSLGGNAMKIDKLTPRFNLRWESSRLMLPEHRKALSEHNEEKKKVEKPMLDEQELQEIGLVVMDALHHTLDVRVVYWDDGQYKEIIGTINKVDHLEKWIKVTSDDDVVNIDVDCLKSVERV